MNQLFVMLHDHRARILWASHTAPSEVSFVGATPWQWYSPEEAERVKTAYSHAIALETPQELEAMALLDGTARHWRIWIDPVNASPVVAITRAVQVREEIKLLTPREREILPLLAQDLTSEQIAQQLGISTTTVETHRNHLRQKLKTRSTAGLVRFAMLSGLAD